MLKKLKYSFYVVVLCQLIPQIETKSSSLRGFFGGAGAGALAGGLIGGRRGAGWGALAGGVSGLAIGASKDAKRNRRTRSCNDCKKQKICQAEFDSHETDNSNDETDN